MTVMGESLFYSIGLFLVGTAVVMWLHLEKKAGKTLLTMASVATIAAALIALRMYYYSDKISVWVLQIPLAAMDAIRYFAMGKAFDPNLEWRADPFYNAYCAMEIILSILAPLLTATVLAFVTYMLYDRVRLVFRSNRPICYFSELNDRSLTLARTIRDGELPENSKKKTKFVFCKVNGQNPLRTEAQTMGAVLIDEPVYLLRIPDPNTRQVRIFLMDDQEENNIQSFLKMQEGFCVKKAEREDSGDNKPESDVLVFSTQESAELVFDEVLMSLDKETLAYDLHLVNETRLVTHKLMQDHPLYEAAEACGQDRISMLVVGCGYLGNQIMKAAMLCGMMDSYEFDIQVIDDQADRLEQQFDHEHPFLSKPSAVFPAKPGGTKPALAPVFHKANVCTSNFDQKLKDYCGKCNYIVVTTGDDQLNINTAQYLRRWYTRRVLKGEETENLRPLVFAAVRNPERYRELIKLEESNDKENGYAGKLFLFANNMEVYSARCVLDRPLDKVAAMFNVCYDRMRNTYDERRLLDWSREVRRDSKQRLLHLPVMTQRSNQLAALHSLYKLQDLLHWQATQCPGSVTDPKSLAQWEGDRVEELFFRLAQLMNKRGSALYDLEHRRWTLFHALNGWDLYPHDQLLEQLKNRKTKIGPKEKVHRNESARLHGCMVPTNKLEPFAQELEEFTHRDEDFQRNDQVMCLASLFAWLELSVGLEKAQEIRAEIRTNLQDQNQTDGLLKQICRMQKEKSKC